MESVIRKSESEAAGSAARIIADELKRTPGLVLGLATGRTMESVYRLLAAMHVREGLDFSRCITFNLDEYVGIPPCDEHSYRSYMNHHLFDKVNIDKNNTHLPDGTAPDLGAECAGYEKAIEEAGGIGLQLLGIGRNGHIGFNEPSSPLDSRTRVQSLSSETIAQNSPNFEPPAEMPRTAVTMGIGTILEARRCLLLATGSAKADIIAEAVQGPITLAVPASALRLHPHCTFILDEEAAAKLDGSCIDKNERNRHGG